MAGLLKGNCKFEHVASACAAAMLGHHGGWWSDAGALVPTASSVTSNLLDWSLTPSEWSEVTGCKDKKGAADGLLKLTTSANALPNWWPLVAYLTRTLRLSDQRATAEGCQE